MRVLLTGEQPQDKTIVTCSRCGKRGRVDSEKFHGYVKRPLDRRCKHGDKCPFAGRDFFPVAYVS